MWEGKKFPIFIFFVRFQLFADNHIQPYFLKQSPFEKYNVPLRKLNLLCVLNEKLIHFFLFQESSSIDLTEDSPPKKDSSKVRIID